MTKVWFYVKWLQPCRNYGCNKNNTETISNNWDLENLRCKKIAGCSELLSP